jgi:putative membrane protein
LCIIPSLYAWFNIYSNWDPYANTSSLKVAVVSEDSGFSSKGSDPVNMGNQVVEQLHDNTGVGWVFPQDTDAALKGVYDGSYYAAIIIGDDEDDEGYNNIIHKVGQSISKVNNQKMKQMRILNKKIELVLFFKLK